MFAYPRKSQLHAGSVTGTSIRCSNVAKIENVGRCAKQTATFFCESP